MGLSAERQELAPNAFVLQVLGNDSSSHVGELGHPIKQVTCAEDTVAKQADLLYMTMGFRPRIPKSRIF